MRKGYVHIKEYLLTKLILDRLDVDIEDGFELIHGICPLYYKDKVLILPEYEKFNKHTNKGTVILRPFINIAHAQYLINMFSDIKEKDILFEHRVNDEEDGYDGTFYIQDRNGERKISLYRINNIPVLMTGLLLKIILNDSDFKKGMGSIIKIDKRIEAK